MRDRPVRRAISARLATPSSRSARTTRSRLSSRSDRSDPEAPLLMHTRLPRLPTGVCWECGRTYRNFGQNMNELRRKCAHSPAGLSLRHGAKRDARGPRRRRIGARRRRIRASPRAPVPLLVLVFTGGAASLGAEIAAARLLAPDFGASTVIWANTIGVVLVALSVGYWLGGRFADRHPHERALRLTVLAAAVLLAVVPLVAGPFLHAAVRALDHVDAGAFIGSLAAVLVLVALPVLLLGAISPWAIRLAVDVGGAGGRGRRPPVRRLDDRKSRRCFPLRARAHPARRHAAHVHRLRDRARARRGGIGPAAPGAARPARARRAAGAAARA